MGDSTLFSKIFAQATLSFPNLKLNFKEHSKLCVFINFVLRIFTRNNDFIDKFWTTIGNTIYIPNCALKDKKNTDHWLLLAHELGHVYQSKSLTFSLYVFLYLWPVSGGILLLLTCWIPLLVISNLIWSYSIFALWTLTSIVFLTPLIPAYWRTRFELECYCLALYLEHKHMAYIINFPQRLNALVDTFSSLSYYRMCSRKRARKLLKGPVTSIGMTGNYKIKGSLISHHPVVKMVNNVFEEYKIKGSLISHHPVVKMVNNVFEE